MLNGGNTIECEGVTLEKEVGKPANIPSRADRWVRAPQLPDLFCSWDLAYRCHQERLAQADPPGQASHDLPPSDVLNCMRRIEAGELPSPRPKRRAR